MKSKFKLSSIIMYAVLFVFVAITLFPLYIMLVTSTKSQLGFITNFWGIQWPICTSNYVKAWNAINKYIFNSIKVTSLIVLGVICTSVLAGYAFAKLKFKFKNALFIGILIFNMIPMSFMTIPSFVLMFKMHLTDSHLGLILSSIGGASIMPILLSKSFFEGIYDAIFESARIEGASEMQVLTKIVVPMSKPIIGTVSLFTFFSSFNQFMWPYLLLSSDKLKTIPIGLNKLMGQYGINFGFQMAAYSIVCVPLIILITLTMKVYVNGITLGAVK